MDRRRNISRSLVVTCGESGAWTPMTCPFMQLGQPQEPETAPARVIQGMRRQIKPGEILEMQLDEEKAQFPGESGRASRAPTAPANSCLQSLASEPCLWDVALGCYSELVAEG